MRMRLAVAVIVPAVLAGAAGIVAEASFGVSVPGPFGVAQPQVRVRVLAGLLPLLATGAALSLWRPAERDPRLLLAMATAMAHPAELDVLREIGGVGRLPSKVTRA